MGPLLDLSIGADRSVHLSLPKAFACFQVGEKDQGEETLQRSDCWQEGGGWGWVGSFRIFFQRANASYPEVNEKASIQICFLFYAVMKVRGREREGNIYPESSSILLRHLLLECKTRQIFSFPPLGMLGALAPFPADLLSRYKSLAIVEFR